VARATSAGRPQSDRHPRPCPGPRPGPRSAACRTKRQKHCGGEPVRPPPRAETGAARKGPCSFSRPDPYPNASPGERLGPSPDSHPQGCRPPRPEPLPSSGGGGARGGGDDPWSSRPKLSGCPRPTRVLR
jgi:hypothetical protein